MFDAGPCRGSEVVVETLKKCQKLASASRACSLGWFPSSWSTTETNSSGASRKPPAGALPLPLRQSASNPPDPPNGLLTLSRAARHTSGVSWLGNRRLPRGDLVNHDP
jgi:hypothetical protein